MFKYELATLVMLNIETYCYSYLNELADLWCLRGRCLPIVLQTVNVSSVRNVNKLRKKRRLAAYFHENNALF